MTKATSAAASATRDPRTDQAIALDDTVAWLRGHVPDRFPEPWDPRAADKSFAADRASELAARLKLKHGRAATWSRDLKEPLHRLPRALVDFELDRYKLAELRTAIDDGIDRIEHPPAPPAPSTDLVELARDLGVKLPATHDAALTMVGNALVAVRSENGADQRARCHWNWLLGALGAGEGVHPVAARARHALVGFGLSPVRADDRVFAMTADELCPAAPALVPLPAATNRQVPRWLESLGIELGLGPCPTAPAAALEGATARREQLGRDRSALEARRRSGDLKSTAASSEFEKAREDLRRADIAINVELERHRFEAYRGWHVAIVERLDAAIAPLRKSEPGSLKCWWLRQLRAHVAMNPADRGLDFTGEQIWPGSPNEEIVAMRVVRSFAVPFTKAAP